MKDAELLPPQENFKVIGKIIEVIIFSPVIIIITIIITRKYNINKMQEMPHLLKMHIY